MPVIFENQGEADHRALIIHGVSAKDNPDAIGEFGRGFKDAVGILLRNNHKIMVQIGLKSYEFTHRPSIIRGQEFGLVYMLHSDGTEQELGFTTNVAKDWEMWMAYRELYCNSIDEHGTVYHSALEPEPEAGITRVLVWGREFEQTHYDRKSFILTSQPQIQSEPCEVHRGQSPSIFYRGIKVATLETPSFFTYNIVDRASLTEDRTLRFAWTARDKIMETISKVENKDLLKNLARLKEGSFFETSESFPTNFTPNEAFCEVIGEIVKNKIGFISPNLYEFYRRSVEDKEEPERFTLDHIQQQMLESAFAFCLRHGYDVAQYELNFAASLGSGHMACVMHGNIWISKECFDSGTKILAHAMIEEFIHKHYGISDFTREFQEHIFQKMLSLMEQIDGRPIW